MINVKSSGSFAKTLESLARLQKGVHFSDLDRLAKMGVNALAAATPSESGETANSWSYEIKRSGSKVSISWLNSNTNDGANVAILLQYGHGTGTGGYVEGRDYINPAMQPIFDMIANEVWKQVQNA